MVVWTSHTIYFDEAKDLPPAMFGGVQDVALKTAAGSCLPHGSFWYSGTETEHCHVFLASGYDYDVCAGCGMSDVYYKWAYGKKS